MNDNFTLKKALYNFCKKSITEKINTLEQRTKSMEESRDNETKSSAGDKFETGRAMMQMEVEKNSRQLSEAHQVNNVLAQIEVEQDYKIVAPGSLVETSQGMYFLAIGMGKIPFEGKVYYGISVASPIGQVMLHKEVGDGFVFNGKTVEILGIY